MMNFRLLFQEKDFEENEHLAALRAMQYSDSDTPQGQAEDEKKRGNDAFRRGPKFFKHALFYYNVSMISLAVN